jgi:cytochrome c oxidase subunit 2
MMTQLVIGIAVVLVLAILIMIFRIQTLLSVMRGSYRKRAGMSNKINAILFMVTGIVGFAAFFWYSGVASEHYLPTASSKHGIETDFMFWLTMGILVFAFVVTHIFLLYFPFRYQYKEERKAFFYAENHKLEFVWTIIPAIVMAILVFFGWRTWSDIMKKEPKESMVIEVMGQQFNWLVRYPGADEKLGTHSFKNIDATNQFGLKVEDKNSWDDFAPREIHVPVGKPVLLRIRARDVLHSVYLPHFRVKMDAVPGMPTKFWFVPTKTTQQLRQETGNPNFNYELACAEICGRGHFSMRYVMVVEEEEEYNKWVAQQQPWAEANRDYVLAHLPEQMKGMLPAAKVTTEVQPVVMTTPIDTASADSVKK